MVGVFTPWASATDMGFLPRELVATHYQHTPAPKPSLGHGIDMAKILRARGGKSAEQGGYEK